LRYTWDWHSRSHTSMFELKGGEYGQAAVFKVPGDDWEWCVSVQYADGTLGARGYGPSAKVAQERAEDALELFWESAKLLGIS